MEDGRAKHNFRNDFQVHLHHTTSDVLYPYNLQCSRVGLPYYHISEFPPCIHHERTLLFSGSYSGRREAFAG